MGANHGQQEKKPQDTFAGEWVKATISADLTTCTWRNGARSKVRIDGDKITMRSAGQFYDGKLECGYIRWNDGDVWMRAQVAPLHSEGSNAAGTDASPKQRWKNSERRKATTREFEDNVIDLRTPHERAAERAAQVQDNVIDLRTPHERAAQEQEKTAIVHKESRGPLDSEPRRTLTGLATEVQEIGVVDDRDIYGDEEPDADDALAIATANKDTRRRRAAFSALEAHVEDEACVPALVTEPGSPSCKLMQEVPPDMDCKSQPEDVPELQCAVQEELQCAVQEEPVKCVEPEIKAEIFPDWQFAPPADTTDAISPQEDYDPWGQPAQWNAGPQLSLSPGDEDLWGMEKFTGKAASRAMRKDTMRAPEEGAISDSPSSPGGRSNCEPAEEAWTQPLPMQRYRLKVHPDVFEPNKRRPHLGWTWTGNSTSPGGRSSPCARSRRDATAT